MADQIKESVKKAHAAIIECIRRLIFAYTARVSDEDRESSSYPKCIGKIDIVVDNNDEINAAWTEQRYFDGGYRIIIMRVKKSSEADILEKILTTCALDRQALQEAITVLDPSYAKPEYRDDLAIVAEQIANALLNATVVEPTSPRYALLKELGDRALMAEKDKEPTEPTAAERVRAVEYEEEMDRMVIEYIGCLLNRYDELLDADSGIELGRISILMDDGVIGSYLNDTIQPNSSMLMLCLPTMHDIDEVEDILKEWGADEENLADVIKSFRPEYPDDPEFYEDYIDGAVGEISHIFLRAVVIPPDSFMYNQLCAATGCRKE